MPTGRTLVALLFAALIALAPALAEARAGGSYGRSGGGSFSSQGSRGMNTYSTPMQRSITPQQSPSAARQAPGYGGYGSSHPFLTGLAGGLFGGWLGSMLFPHWGMGGMGYGGGFGGGVIGPIFTWLIIIWLAWMGFRFFSRRFGAAASQGGGTMAFGGIGGAGGGSAAAPAQQTPLAISGADYQAFERILKDVQAAWSRADLAALRHNVTPEMLSYFSEELAENESRGVSNRVEQVELLRGDLREAWDEGRLQYATCYLSWRALDYTVQSSDPNTVVSGDRHQPTEAGEAWTFARSPGGQWLLSAIQQV
jgi:predicted lipid-binding transport protein (Tim44 family)